MEIIFTGPKRDASALNRILRTDGIETTLIMAADPPNAAVLLSTDDPVDRTAIARAIERMERERDAEDDDVVDKDTPKRAPEGLYWRVFAAIRTAHARIEPYEQAEEALAPDDVEWAASIGLDDVYKVMRAVEAEHGVWRMAIEQAVEKGAALLMGMRAIALVLRNPLADSRREINGEDPEKRFNSSPPSPRKPGSRWWTPSGKRRTMSPEARSFFGKTENRDRWQARWRTRRTARESAMCTRRRNGVAAGTRRRVWRD